MGKDEDDSKDSNPGGDERTWGWCSFKPRCLQFLNNESWFMVFFLTYHLFQVMNGTFTSAAIPTIEARYHLSSKLFGLIISANDIAALILLPIVNHFGETRHKPKWFGIGAFVSMLGGLLFILPQAFEGVGSTTKAANKTTPLCLNTNFTLPPESTSCKDEAIYSHSAFAIFILARLLMGAGSSPVYGLGVSFIDDNIKPKYADICLGLVQACNFLGPSIGYIIQGYFLQQVYIDVELPAELKRITGNDPRWLGNWWLAFLISSAMLLISSLALLGYPRALPGMKERKIKKLEKMELQPSQRLTKDGISGFLLGLWKLCKNKVYIITVAGRTIVMMFWAGIIPFFYKIVQQKFGANNQDTGLGVSVIAGPGVALGIVLGGFLSRKFNLMESMKKAAKWCFLLQIPALVGGLPFLIPACDVVSLAGVTKPYINNSLSPTPILLSTCNSYCACSDEIYDPVCGSDGLTYFSPCYAGCGTEKEKVFMNCSCALNSGPKTANRGICERGCKKFLLFVVLYTLCVILATLNFVATQVVILRCVPENFRSLGSGLLLFFGTSLGRIPGPIIVGHLIDNTCLLWLRKCGKTGNCLHYDISKVVMVIVVGNTVVQTISWLLHGLGWFFSSRIRGSQKCPSVEHIMGGLDNNDERENESHDGLLDSSGKQSVTNEQNTCL